MHFLCDKTRGFLQQTSTSQLKVKRAMKGVHSDRMEDAMNSIYQIHQNDRSRSLRRTNECLPHVQQSKNWFHDTDPDMTCPANVTCWDLFPGSFQTLPSSGCVACCIPRSEPGWGPQLTAIAVNDSPLDPYPFERLKTTVEMGFNG